MKKGIGKMISKLKNGSNISVSIKYIVASVVFFALTAVLYFFSGGEIYGSLFIHAALWVFAHAPFISDEAGEVQFLHFLGLEILFSVFYYLMFFTAKLDILVMPIIAFSFLASQLYTPLISIFMSIALVLFSVAGYPELFSANVLIAYLVVCTFAASIVSMIKQRMNLVIMGLAIGVIMYLIVIAQDFSSLELRQAYALLNGVISPILAIGIAPIMETLFSMITPMRLLEISNTSKPLLKRLMLEAPGTYHHSLYVAHLAEAAASDIGADNLLARAGAYYHDIGKLENPMCFFENQGGAPNPHDEMSPQESAQCLRDHVRFGVEILKRNYFPKVVVDIVRAHHGDSVMQYFYHKELQSNAEAVLDDFRYSGPSPYTKVESIIMFADCIEAAVRANPDVPKDEMVEKIINQKIEEGQMRDSELSFKEISIIKKSFISALSASAHERIKYPTDKQSAA